MIRHGGENHLRVVLGGFIVEMGEGKRGLGMDKVPGRSDSSKNSIPVGPRCVGMERSEVVRPMALL